MGWVGGTRPVTLRLGKSGGWRGKLGMNEEREGPLYQGKSEVCGHIRKLRESRIAIVVEFEPGAAVVFEGLDA